MGKWDALEAAVRWARQGVSEAIAAGSMSGGEIVRQAALVEPWKPGPFAVGAVRSFQGQVWRCCQAHDSTGNETWAPGPGSALWAAYHAADAGHARPWVAPTGAHDAYQAGEYMVWTDGTVWRCKQANTVHAPDVLPGAWEKQT